MGGALVASAELRLAGSREEGKERRGLVAPSPGTAAGRQGMLTRGNRGAT
jgi:hypothetical protein